MNKKDSSFAIGEIEIFVNQNDYNSSIQIIEDHPDLWKILYKDQLQELYLFL